MTQQCQHCTSRFGSFSPRDLEVIQALLTKDLVIFEWESSNANEGEVKPSVEKRPFDPSAFEYAKLAAFQFAPQPKGLINRGNTCFMNAVLQPLIHLRPFFALFKEFGKQIYPDELNSTDYGLIEAFVTLSDKFPFCSQNSFAENSFRKGNFHSIVDSVAPDAVYDALKCKGSILKAQGAQEDAHEFLCHLIDGLHEEFLKLIPTLGKRFLVAKENSKPLEHHASEEGPWKKILSKKERLPSIQRHSFTGKETPISSIFSGCTRSSIRIINSNNHKESVTIEPFFCLQLDVEHQAKPTLFSALHALSEPENVQYSISGVAHNASKSILFESLPPILCINFKTFVYSFSTGDTLKLDKFISYPSCFQFPSELIHQSEEDDFDAISPVYRLVSVVYHHGKGAGGGHYTADVLVGGTTGKTNWIRFDDDIVTEIGLEDVLREKPHQSAYILFYERVECGQEAKMLLQQAKEHENDQIMLDEASEGANSSPQDNCSMDSSAFWTTASKSSSSLHKSSRQHPSK